MVSNLILAEIKWYLEYENKHACIFPLFAQVLVRNEAVFANADNNFVKKNIARNCSVKWIQVNLSFKKLICKL